MTIGLKIHEILDDDEIKKRAEQRKAESDQVLELIYSKLIDTIKKKNVLKGAKP